MNTATIIDLAWEGAQIAFRLIMAARTRRDAEAIVHQLRALGPAQRADVDAVEAEALDRFERATAGAARELRRPIAPDFPGDLDGGE